MKNIVKATLILGVHVDDFAEGPGFHPFVAGAIDHTMGEHLDQDEWDKMIREAKETWAGDPRDFEWREVTAVFTVSDLAAAFHTPTVEGHIER